MHLILQHAIDVFDVDTALEKALVRFTKQAVLLVLLGG